MGATAAAGALLGKKNGERGKDVKTKKGRIKKVKTQRQKTEKEKRRKEKHKKKKKQIINTTVVGLDREL